MLPNIIQIIWLCLFFFQIGFSFLFFLRYHQDKRKRKLIFGIGFLISSFTYIYHALSLSTIAENQPLMYNFYFWSFFPLIFAIGVAVHESLLPFRINRRIDYIFYATLLISFPIVVLSPLPVNEIYTYFAAIVTIELILVSIFVILKFRRQFDLYFFMSILMLGIGGMSLATEFDQSFSLLALFIGLVFIGSAFHESKQNNKETSNTISRYFSLQKQLNNTKKELDKTEQKYRHIAESSSDLISMMTFSFPPKYTYISPSHQKVMGYKPSDLLGKNALAQIHPDDVDFLITLIKKYLKYSFKSLSQRKREGFEETFEFRVKDNDGNWHYLESKANLAGREILLISRDITKRKETENELLKTKAFLEASINQSPAGILIADAPDVTIRYANPAALGIRGDSKERLTGIAVEEHVKQWQTYYPDGTEYDPKDLPLSKAILKGEIVQDEEVIIRDKNGADRYVITNASPVKNENGEIIAGVVVFSDISDLIEAQETEWKSQQNLIRLNNDVFEMLQLPSIDEMYSFIGNTLTDLIDDAVIITGDFNEKQDQTTVKHIFGLEHHRLKKLLSLLKVNPIGKTFPFREDIKQLYKQQKIFEINGGLSALSKSEYSSLVIKKVERLLNLKKIYTIGLRQKDQLFAWVHIFKFNQAELENKQMIELFLSQSSLLLQRKFYEEKNNELANIVKQSDDAIIQTNDDFEIIYMNPKAEEMFGYTLKELIGKTPDLFNAEETAEEIQQKIYDDLSQRKTFFGTYLNKRKNGETFWCQMKVTPLVDEQEKIYGYLSSQRDVSERKKIEEEQKKLHRKSLILSKTANELQRFSFEKDIFEYIGINIEKLAGNCLIFLSIVDEKTAEFKVKKTYGSQKILKKISSFIGQDFTSTTLQIEMSFFEKYLNTDTLQRIPEDEFKNLILPSLPKGAYLFAKKMFNLDEIYIMSLTENGIVHGSVTIAAYKGSLVENTDVIETFVNQAAVALQRNRAMKDLSEMNKNLEEKVRERTQEIHRLLKQKDEFINQLGHDLKNPLGPLVNLLPIIEKHSTNPKDKKILQVTQRNVNYMKNLVQKTLELARLNSQNTTLSMIPINVNEQIQDIIERNSYMFNEKQITVSSSVPSTLIVKADLLRFEELVSNLLNNSVKYNDEQGHIHIEAFEKEDFITISIQDDGIGMEKNQLNHIFDEFYKADESRHDFDSSGLGMPICKRIVEKHGGTIWAESDGLGKGSTISFTLPKQGDSNSKTSSIDHSQSSIDQTKSDRTISEKIDEILSKRQL